MSEFATLASGVRLYFQSYADLQQPKKSGLFVLTHEKAAERKGWMTFTELRKNI